MSPRPHDLLRLAPSGFAVPDDAPEWAACVLARDEPWVVVRRAVPEPGMIPVGARGCMRNERFAFSVPTRCVRERATPERIAGERRWRTVRAARGKRGRFPAFSILDGVAGWLERHRLAWGVVGSVGFELASGVPAVTRESDLDLILRCPEPVPPSFAREILEGLARLPARADAQLDSGCGSLALAEWASRESADDPVMLRRAQGPVLTRDPWLEFPAEWEASLAGDELP